MAPSQALAAEHDPPSIHRRPRASTTGHRPGTAPLAAAAVVSDTPESLPSRCSSPVTASIAVIFSGAAGHPLAGRRDATTAARSCLETVAAAMAMRPSARPVAAGSPLPSTTAFPKASMLPGDMRAAISAPSPANCRSKYWGTTSQAR